MGYKDELDAIKNAHKALRSQKDKEYRARKKATGWQDQRGNRHPLRSHLPFIGCDGEGGEVVQDKDGNWVTATGKKPHHEYLCLRIGDQLLTNPGYAPLTAKQCLEFIADQDPNLGVYVAYFFDYDVTMMLRGLPRERLERLMDRAGRTYRMKHNGMSFTYPVEWGGFEFDYMPRKEFKVRRKGGKFVTINDVGTFYQCAFLKALQAWKVGTPEDWEHIAEGKSGRVNFGALTKETIRYNEREIVLLQELCEKFRNATRAAAMEPKKWQGPGNIASAIYDRVGMIKGQDVADTLPEGLIKAANESYFGGRFEITAVGPVTGPVYQHDINSAYPYATTKLPCLVHGKWSRISCAPNFSEHMSRALYLAYGNFTVTDASTNLYAFPVRDKLGRISWPGSAGYGWYWSHEINEAVYQKFNAETAWVYEPQCDCEPFNWVPDLYRERSKLGKESKGIAIKLGLNSTYGKLCQSVGSPKYANPIYASLITSYTRAQLYRKCVALGVDKVLMLATDGIFTTSEVDKDHSPKYTVWNPDTSSEYTLKPLGDWEVTEWPNGIFIVQPGLYFKPGEKYAKTRGVPLNKFLESTDQFEKNYDYLYELIGRWGLKATVPVKHKGKKVSNAFDHTAVAINVRNFMGIRLGVHIKSDSIGEWLEDQKKISFDWSSKRSRKCELVDGTIRLIPFLERGDNVPYSKDIGAMWREAKLLSSGNFDPDMGEFLGMPEEME